LSEILSACPAPGGGVHGWLLSAANQCRNAGLTHADAEALIAAKMTRPPSGANEVGDAVRKAYSTSGKTWNRPLGATSRGSSPPKEELMAHRSAQQSPPRKLSEIEFNPEKLAAVADQITMPYNWRYWLWERSPRLTEFRSGFWFLSQLYEQGEKVHVFDRMETLRPTHTFCITPDEDCRVSDDVKAHIKCGGTGAGVWYLCNPVDGCWHHTSKDGHSPSWRSQASITAFRYAVLESDRANPSQWMAFIAQTPLRIAAIYTSGGRSIHTLIRLDAGSKEEWDSIVEPWKRPLKVLGGDPGCLTAVRLTRLPGCHRPEKGGFQQLWYLAPKPVEARLIDLPKMSDRADTLPSWRRCHARRKAQWRAVQ